MEKMNIEDNIYIHVQYVASSIYFIIQIEGIIIVQTSHHLLRIILWITKNYSLPLSMNDTPYLFE